ncbi:MAG: N-6 DNA methylase [Cenarchaeum sp. SB0675_bin_21]|nr:N-6 DNA methylase [Cenarchaeum sp. SB0675_bin_21]
MYNYIMSIFDSALTDTLQRYLDLQEYKGSIVTASDYNKINYISKSLINDNTKTVISVIIPQNMQNNTYDAIVERLESNQIIQYAIYQKVGKDVYRLPHSDKHFISGDIHNLVASISTLEEDTNKIVQSSIRAVRASADKLQTEHQKNIIKKTVQKSWLGASQSASLILFSGILMQQHLSKYRDDIPPLNSVADATSVLKTWKHIINLKQFDIFKPPTDILDLLVAESITSANNTLQPLTDAIINTKDTPKSTINAGMTLLPYISDDRSTAAEYYTRDAIAEMLACLTIKEAIHDMDYFREHKIADLTCGTGALLRAGYRRMRSLHQRYHGLSGMAELRHGALNGGLVGIDISPVATYLASVSLLLTDDEWYNPSGITHVGVGGPAGMTGAIEYITGQEHPNTGDEQTDIPRIPDKSIDYILMNPPYSRSRNGQASFDVANLTEAERSACQARWEGLIRTYPAKKVAGMAPTFIIIASKKIKDYGRIGFVLPITAAFAEAWAETRRFIQYNYTEIIAITISSGKSLSHGTHLTEMLLIATKTPQPKERPSSIYCVTLNKAPATPPEAGEMARAIQDSCNSTSNLSWQIQLGDTIGSMYKYDAKPGQPWSPLGVKDSGVALFTDLLIQGRFRKIDGTIMPINIQMARIQDIFCIGPTHHIIGHTKGSSPMGAFELRKIDDGHTPKDDAHYSLWNVSKSQDRLIISPTHYGIPMGRVDNITQHNTTLFYNRRLSWSVNALLGATTKDKIMGGNGWLGLGHSDVRILKAAALWFNSTLGLMTHWSQASRSEPGRATAQVKAIKNIPCPRFDTLDDSTLCMVAKFFDQVSSSAMLPACYAHIDKTRHMIDDAISEMLKVSNDTIKDIRLQFCQEPTIHNYAKKPLEALNQ